MDFRQNDFFKYASQIRNAEIAERIPRDLLAIALFQASQFEPDKISGKGLNPLGVIGIGKITRSDCAWLWGGEDLRADPAAAIRGAARILARYYHRFNSWPEALAAYHCAPDFVVRHKHGQARLPIDARRYLGEAAALAVI
jgi:hypothetical protein